jgi:hypothetical protein
MTSTTPTSSSAPSLPGANDLPSWTLDSSAYRERKVADRIVAAKTKEIFSIDDRLIRKYEKEVMKKFEDCVTMIPTSNVRVDGWIILCVFENARSLRWNAFARFMFVLKIKQLI